MGFIQAFEMLAGTALRLEVTIETQAVTGSLPSGPCIGQSAPFRLKNQDPPPPSDRRLLLARDCDSRRQTPPQLGRLFTRFFSLGTGLVRLPLCRLDVPHRAIERRLLSLHLDPRAAELLPGLLDLLLEPLHPRLGTGRAIGHRLEARTQYSRLLLGGDAPLLSFRQRRA